MILRLPMFSETILNNKFTFDIIPLEVLIDQN